MGMQKLEWIDIGEGTYARSERKQGAGQAGTSGQLRRRETGQPLGEEELLRRQAAEERRQRILAQERRKRMTIDNRIEEPPRPGRNSVTTIDVTAPPRRETPERQQKKRRKRRKQARFLRSMFQAAAFLLFTGLLLTVAFAANYIYGKMREKEEAQPATKVMIEEQTLPQDIRKWGAFYATQLDRPELTVDLLTINEFSRPGEPLPEVKNIFVHYTANAGTTAEQNKSYFQSLAETRERSASAHFIIGFDGVIVQCIPTAEIAYAVKERNYDSISIECCFLDESGIFTRETYGSLIELTAWLLHKYELNPEDVLRHYDEGGKICPKYYVEHEDAWLQFLRDLENYMIEVTR